MIRPLQLNQVARIGSQQTSTVPLQTTLMPATVPLQDAGTSALTEIMPMMITMMVVVMMMKMMTGAMSNLG